MFIKSSKAYWNYQIKTWKEWHFYSSMGWGFNALLTCKPIPFQNPEISVSNTGKAWRAFANCKHTSKPASKACPSAYLVDLLPTPLPVIAPQSTARRITKPLPASRARWIAKQAIEQVV